MPLPLLGSAERHFHVIHPCSYICASICDVFLWYLWYALMDFRPTFVSSASWDIDELVRFWDQKVKVKGHSMTKCAKNTVFWVCLRDVFSVKYWWIKTLSLLHLGTKINWSNRVLGSKGQRPGSSGEAYRAWSHASCSNLLVINVTVILLLSFRRLYVFGSSVRAAVRLSVRPSVIHVVVFCFRDISSICWDELIRFWGQKVKVQGHGMTECIPDFHVSTISPVSIDKFSPNFCHSCILGHRWPDYVFGSKGQSSSHTIVAEAHRHSTLDANVECNFF